MLRAAAILSRRFQDLQFVLPVAPTLSQDFMWAFLDKSAVPVTMIDGKVYDVLRASDAALVTSGTATLETGLMAVPMVIVYRMSGLSHFIGRMIINVNHIGLVNIVAGKRLVPELVQQDATPDNMADAVTKFLDDPAYRQRVSAELAALRSQLGEAGASERIASVVLNFLQASA
jgi:lipid-A-disaccharide synthase